MRENINWMGYEWETTQRWGDVHPDGLLEYYDSGMVNINKEGHLILDAEYNPKTFNINGRDVLVDYRVGLVNCKTPFGYGTYEIEAKLPIGDRLWSAFWMWSFGDKYAEIDVFEGYTNRWDSYLRINWKNLLGFWKVMTNVYYGRNAANHIGESTKFFGFKSPSKNFMKYKLLWTKDVIKVWYRDVLIREITNEYTLGKMRGVDMNVILNLSVRDDTMMDQTTTPFIIKSFKYTQIK